MFHDRDPPDQDGEEVYNTALTTNFLEYQSLSGSGEWRKFVSLQGVQHSASAPTFGNDFRFADYGQRFTSLQTG